MRFLWQRRGIKQLFRSNFTSHDTLTSPCRLQPIYYFCVLATVRLSKILVHTPTLAPLPLLSDPGHMACLCLVEVCAEEQVPMEVMMVASRCWTCFPLGNAVWAAVILWDMIGFMKYWLKSKKVEKCFIRKTQNCPWVYSGVPRSI